ncbi:MAG TPA: organomercurial lyase [Ktedonobacterales bacterium]|nr:organomercurial lyase [Ktedonobacterales bacterium]
MDANTRDDLNWTIRAFVYEFIVANERPPTTEETASALSVPPETVQAAYGWLHARHALYLAGDGQTIRMAHPFSAVPTDFRVFANGHAYWANCAWDMLGIPAALRANAQIEARLSDTGAPVSLAVEGGRVRGHGEVVSFPLPFSRWYDDLVYT